MTLYWITEFLSHIWREYSYTTGYSYVINIYYWIANKHGHSCCQCKYADCSNKSCAQCCIASLSLTLQADRSLSVCCLCVCESLIAAQYQDCTFCNSCMGTSLPNNSVAVASCSSKHAISSRAYTCVPEQQNMANAWSRDVLQFCLSRESNYIHWCCDNGCSTNQPAWQCVY